MDAEDREVLAELEKANELYERYLELSRVAEVPVDMAADATEEPLPPRTDLPLTLEIRSPL